jgi:ornithine decarboxylase
MKAISLAGKRSAGYLRGLELARVEDISRSLPTPFMILRLPIVRRNLKNLRAALPGVDVYYAVKANNHADILRTLRKDKCRFDISSVRELQDVLRIGGQAAHVIHTNPIKSLPEFDDAVAGGVRTFVADNAAELDKFARYGDRAGALVRFKTTPGGAAVNLSYKFGADPDEVPALLDKIIALKIPFRGFCFHVGSQCTKSSRYTAAIKTAGRLIDIARAKGLSTDILDIGGGFPVKYTRAVPAIETIGTAVTQALRRHIPSKVRVICEPGRFISGEAVTLIASVIGTSVRNGVKWYYIDDGLYGSFSGRLFDGCSYEVLTNRNTKWERAVLAGPTCDSFDVIYNDCLMPPLSIGDMLIFPAMGAYCSVSATDFNGLGRSRVVSVNW